MALAAVPDPNAEARRILAKFPDRIPIVCDREKDSNLPSIAKRKFLVLRPMRWDAFQEIINSNIRQITPDVPLAVLFVQGRVLEPDMQMADIYEHHKAPDGLLHITYGEEKKPELLTEVNLEKVREAFQSIQDIMEAIATEAAPSQEAATARVQVQLRDAGVLPDGAGVRASNTDPESDLQSVRLTELQALHDDLANQVRTNPDFFGEDGSNLCVGLHDLSADFSSPLPVGREQTMLRQAVHDYVRGVLAELQQDSEGRTRLMDDYRNDIHDKMETVRKFSDSLGSEMLPGRIEIERQRARLVRDLADLHQKRSLSVTEPSRMPGLLQEKLQAFQEQHNGHLSELGALRQRHQQAALESQVILAKQKVYQEEQSKRCQEEVDEAREQERRCRADLKETFETWVYLSTRIQQLLKDVKSARSLTAAKEVERSVALNLLDRAMEHQEKIRSGNEALSQRFTQGQHLLQGFATWLRSAYQWMKSNMEQKRAALAAQMPEEREKFRALLDGLCKDADRRKQEKQWAMREMMASQEEELRKAKCEEQVGTERARATVAAHRSRVARMDEDLKRLQQEYEDLEKMQEETKTICSKLFGPDAIETPSGHHALSWVTSFFFNSFPTRRRYVPEAIQDVPAPTVAIESPAPTTPTWGECLRRRLTGKRPVSELEDTPRKRRRCLHDAA